MTHSVERLPVRVYADDRQASIAVARRIAGLVRERAARGLHTVLGLATGHTPINVYRELARMHRQEGLDLSSVITFNLDEYWPIAPEALQSYWTWMHENFFNHVNIKPENIHIPSGTVSEGEMEAYCAQYEQWIRDAGGIDLQILGIGRTGHIGFNEPGSGKDSRTRRIDLDRITRMDAASDFFGEEHVPKMAITMGVGTILAAREICLLAFGEHKAPVLRKTVEGEICDEVAASYLQEHPNVTFFIDESSAAELTRFQTPWMLGPCEWDDLLVRQAVIWLSRKENKPILKLTDEDYRENGLAELLRLHGGAYNINLEVFHRLMRTITGWPGGRNGKKRILVFSPHPDDDVICMAGTMSRFAQQGHEIHVAYMVSGYLSVFDHDAMRYADFVRDCNKIFAFAPEKSEDFEQHIDRFLRRKRPGEMDTPEVQQIKALIRKTEATAAAVFSGLKEENVHFLDMPFYNTGVVQKKPIDAQDVEVVRQVLEEVRPEMVFAAGDMSDPHGTHRQCLDALMIALDQYKRASNQNPEIWFYRGAWQEWPVGSIDMAVPLSPDELKAKRMAIFRHQSQKDRAMFPGPYDSREFWQRAEDRNQSTAKIYDAVGLPEYHAIEAFAKWPIPRAAQAQAELESLGD